MDIINVKHFKKAFKDQVVHDDVSFSVKKGECLGLVGGSGVGKSIILKSLIGLIQPDDGVISIHGENIINFDESQMIQHRKNVAYVFQNGALFDSMNVYGNLAYPLKAHTDLGEKEISDKIQSILSMLGLGKIEKKYPSELSGGMQKRVGLARAIILEPEIILYDEPTAGLDPFNTKNIQEIILQLKETGVTSIFVSHDVPSALVVCDQIALLSKGKVIHKESVEDIKVNPQSKIFQFLNGSEI